MKFNLSTLRYHLFIQQGILPERVSLETNFKVDLNMSDNQIRRMLGFVQAQTGVNFPKDIVLYLTDVFDLMIHIMIRAVEVEISEEYYNTISEPVWQNFLWTKFTIPMYAHLN
ncbi:hypothetical protein [Dyadobacter psychrotolerans]|jgi:hypothetical protein|uniref:Uncharacterized protein n=2 Tax=Dyadobacter TaxID=120831 RepID=A0A4R5DGT9_9BACT|nr:hypothetical protein [Dyadobacter psychrotolerans]TDE13252.1 hypothetical protein E0F88_19570 [Dyadobacter psychrotolerans]